MEYKFNIGDKAERINCNLDRIRIGEIVTIKETVITTDEDYHMNYEKDDGSEGWCLIMNLKLTSTNSSLKKTMEKNVYNVLIVDKKTKKVEKNEVVVAEDEQQAILKACGVDMENAFIKVTKNGSFVEDKPVNAVLVKADK